jgi:hypothetical protein
VMYVVDMTWATQTLVVALLGVVLLFICSLGGRRH